MSLNTKFFPGSALSGAVTPAVLTLWDALEGFGVFVCGGTGGEPQRELTCLSADHLTPAPQILIQG